MRSLLSHDYRGLFTALNGLFPDPSVLYIGPGTAGIDFENLSISPRDIHLVEAHPQRARKLLSRYQKSSRIHVHNRVLADKDGPCNFYKKSLESEDGLLDPEALKSIWKNLKLDACVQVDAVTIDSFLSELSDSDKRFKKPNWIIIDCLPAPELLAASVDLLKTLDVAILRLVAGDSRRDSPLYRSSRTYLEKLEGFSDFKTITSIETTNASLVQVVYARDWKHCLQRRLKIQTAEAATELNEACETHALALKALNEETAALQQEKENLGHALESARHSVQSAAKQAEEELNQLRKAHADELQAALEKEQLQSATDKNALQENVTNLDREAETLRERLIAIESDFANAQETFELAQKRQLLAENNLEDMRRQYRELAEERLADQERWNAVQTRLEGLINKVPTSKVETSKKDDASASRKTSPVERDPGKAKKSRGRGKDGGQ